jgi:prepilin-type processing-associated H-X9-DG protein
MLIRETSAKNLPGYINKLGISGTNKIVRAPWTVLTFPQLDQQQLYDRWSSGNIGSGTSIDSTAMPYLAMFSCPSNPPVTVGEPSLSYVVNAGCQDDWAQGPNNTNPPHFNYENAANGVFFDRTRRADVVPPANPQGPPNPTWPTSLDARDASQPNNDAPEISMTIAYIQAKGDGTTKTLMLSESLATLFWAYPSAEYGSTLDASFHFGFNWVQPSKVVNDPRLRINGARVSPQYTTLDEMKNYLTGDGSQNDLNPRPGLPSSNHSGGVNAAFIDGHVVFLNDQMEPQVYAQIMTSNHKQSDLFGANPFESNTPEPTDGSF